MDTSDLISNSKQLDWERHQHQHMLTYSIEQSSVDIGDHGPHITGRVRFCLAFHFINKLLDRTVPVHGVSLQRNAHAIYQILAMEFAHRDANSRWIPHLVHGINCLGLFRNLDIFGRQNELTDRLKHAIQPQNASGAES